MFGYVTVNREKLTEEQWNRYHACYCGLCRTLQQRFGLRGSVTLSNDSTFLMILLSSLYEPEESSGSRRCVFHPVHVHPFIQQGAISDYAADMNIALTYYMCEDHWHDDHSLLAAGEYRLLKKGFEDVCSRHAEKCARIAASLKKLESLENTAGTSADSAAACMGELLGDLFVYREDYWADTLRQTGDGLGRFIYLMDAVDDLASDREKKRFNPLLQLGIQAEEENFQRGILATAMSLCTNAFECLPLEQDLELLRNILYSGVWNRYAIMARRRDKHSQGRKDIANE